MKKRNARKTITLRWLEKKGACLEAVVWFEEKFGKSATVEDVIKARTPVSWLHWLVAKWDGNYNICHHAVCRWAEKGTGDCDHNKTGSCPHPTTVRRKSAELLRQAIREKYGK